MNRLTIFLFFFTLSTMAQQVQDTLGKVKTSEEVANTKIIIGRPKNALKHYPLFIVDGKKYKTKKPEEDIKIANEDIENVVVFLPPEAKKRFDRRAKYGVVYMISKEGFQKAKEIASEIGKRRLNKKERQYREIWEVYQFNLAELSKLSDPSNQFDPTEERNSSEKTKN
ncbi:MULTISPECIES: hypothetical protein [unclassified Capnocytophaga]|uniref:hypothetical protein n=1 Tax=unclassified Capnocytophaga TaxID=2640652 RepID=UPI000202D126|nr:MULTISPECIES: hypothetical protein [unclassified Capnocytophaga]EGD35065.1 hypothetical protein HMPREF9071_0356 [Capnocytophaga sp. oral taxon 338 str. F0234]MEB3003929.1 hypothetical protein [Capnocytophaga sp. G2]